MRIWNHRPRPIARLTPGDRIYAIGDVHGEASLLEKLLGQILADCQEREPARTTLILLGDLIDRGAGAAGLLRMLAPLESDRLVILKGNHESAFVDCYRGDEEALGFWKAFGGRATMASFGISEHDLDTPDAGHLLTVLRSHVEPALIDWLDDLPTFWSAGDYAFVHAGVRPGIRFEQQDESDLIWIREPFLSSRKNHGKVVVHGHTVESGVPRLGGNRIGVDTGAHEYGTLTALGLEDDRQWILQTAGYAPDPSRPSRQPDRTMASASAEPAGQFARIERLIAEITRAHRPDPASPLLLNAASILRPEPAPRQAYRSRAFMAGLAILSLGLSGFILSPYCSARLGPRRAAGPLLTLDLPNLTAMSSPPVTPEAPAAGIASTAGHRTHMLHRHRVAIAQAGPADASAPVPDGAANPSGDGATANGADGDPALALADHLATQRLNGAEIARLHDKQ